MIKTLLDELVAATSTLGAAITTIATRRSVTLTATFTVEPWWSWERETNRTSYPVLSIRWLGTSKTGTQIIAAGIRQATHKVEIAWLHKATDATVMDTHLECIPEALMLWLDTFPISSRSSGKTIHQIAPPDGQTVKLDLERNPNARKGADGTITYEYGVCASFDVRTRESA